MENVSTPAREPGWLRLIDRISIVLAALGGVATVGLMINVVLDVIGRSILNRPLPGTLEITQFAWMPTLVSLGLGYALLRGEHIRVNLLTSPTGPQTQRVVEIIAMTFTLATVGLFIWFGSQSALHSMDIGEWAVGASWLPVAPFRWIVVIGLAGLFLQCFASLWRAITVAEFVPDDDDEAIAAIEAESPVIEQLQGSDALTATQEQR